LHVHQFIDARVDENAMASGGARPPEAKCFDESRHFTETKVRRGRDRLGEYLARLHVAL